MWLYNRTSRQREKVPPLFSPPRQCTVAVGSRSVKRAALLCASIVGAQAALAGTIALEWTPVDHPALAGYRVYHGYASGNYPSSVYVSSGTSVVLDVLEDCTTHYVALKSVDVAGGESTEFSNEIFGWPRPRAESVMPDTLLAGASAALTITGANFQPGATVEIADPDVTVDAVTVDSCWNLRVDVTVAPTAVAGGRTLVVVNPDGVGGSASFSIANGTVELPEFAVYFDMDAASIAGGLIYDQSGNSVIGAVVGTSQVDGLYAEALRFDLGHNDYIRVPSRPELALGPEFTISAWIRAESWGQGGAGAIVDKLELADARGYALRLSGSGGLAFYGLTEQSPLASLPGVLVLRVWHHVAAVYGAGLLTFYIDGEPAGSGVALHDVRPSSRDLYVGNAHGLAMDFSGGIDDLRIHTRALTADEIATLAEPDSPPCIDYDGDGYGWPLSAGCSPDVEPDCDDDDPQIHPGTFDACGDGIDQDCDGSDAVCPCPDADADGFVAEACGGDDCHDADASVHPAAPELCDGIDNDCDGAVDEDIECDLPVDDAHLVADWSMDSDSVVGPWLLDRSANGHVGMIVGATLAPGRVGEALRFVSGHNDYVLVDDADELDLGQAFTISAWIYPETFGQEYAGAIVDKFYPPTAEGYRFQLTNNTSYAGMTFAGATLQGLVYSEPHRIVLREWQRVAVTYASGILAFYVDGVPAGSVAAIHDPRPTFRNLYIGNDRDRTKDFNGLIDELKIYDVALTAEELGGTRTGGACPVTVGLGGNVIGWGPPGLGDGYDVVRGELGLLRDSGGDFGVAGRECLAGATDAAAIDYKPIPLPGDAFWFLVRRTDPSCGFGSPQRDAGIGSAPPGCP